MGRLKTKIKYFFAISVRKTPNFITLLNISFFTLLRSSGNYALSLKCILNILERLHSQVNRQIEVIFVEFLQGPEGIFEACFAYITP